MKYEELTAKVRRANDETNKSNYSLAVQLANEVLSELHISIDGENSLSNVHEKLRADAFLSLAVTSLKRGNYDVALEQAQHVLAHIKEFDLIDVLPKAHNLIGLIHENLGNYDEALEYVTKALLGCEAIGDSLGINQVTESIAGLYATLGQHDKALKYYATVLAAYMEREDKSGVTRVSGNIGIVNYNLGRYEKALEFFIIEHTAHEELGNTAEAARLTGNIGNVYHCLGEYQTALAYHTKALAAHEEFGNKSLIATVMGGIGRDYESLGNYNTAIEYYFNSLAVHEELGEKTYIAQCMSYIGGVYANQTFNGYNAEIAEEFLLKSIAICEIIGAKNTIYYYHQSLANLYKAEKRWEEFAIHFEKFHNIKEEVQSEEAKNQANLMEQRHQAEEREKQIAITKAAADAKHQATEQLLHNVLPPSIAYKILGGTKLIAEKIPSVSVLFADIVNFTKLSQRITPEELVEGLDRIFSTFDALAEKYGLEKIKTIGDAYMVVAGAPIQREDHAESMAHFALDMVEAMKEFRSISTGEEIQLRIGIHSGEVVAGVIGKKKFAYDLWGDAVNTASRMESHGEPGKIHCSEEFVRALSLSSFKSFPSFKFQERGEMEIKSKGMMKTYFLEKQY